VLYERTSLKKCLVLTELTARNREVVLSSEIGVRGGLARLGGGRSIGRALLYSSASLERIAEVKRAGRAKKRDDSEVEFTNND